MSLLQSTQQMADLPVISGFLILSAQRILDARSRAVTSRDDKVSGFRGSVYGMTQSGCFINDPFRHTVIRHLALLSLS